MTGNSVAVRQQQNNSAGIESMSAANCDFISDDEVNYIQAIMNCGSLLMGELPTATT